MIRLLLSSCFILGLSLNGFAKPLEIRSFIIPESEGYGVADCLSGGIHSECGRIVANAWCESQGYAKATGFGQADATDMTASIGASQSKPAGKALIITCTP